MQSELKKRIFANTAWIVGCKIAQACLQLIITIFTARYLGPSNYGLISYAASLTAFVIPVMQLGIRNTLVQEFVNAPESKGTILGTSLVLNTASSLLCIVGVTTFAYVANSGDTITILVCALYSCTLVFQAIEVIQYWFQEKLLSKYVSLIMLLAYFVSAIYQVYLLIFSKSVVWFAISQSLQHVIIAILLFIVYKKKGGETLGFSLKCSKSLISRSKHYILSNMMVTIYMQTDKIMLNNMIDSSAVGVYTAAVTCAGVANFVFLAVIDSMRPPILQSRLVSQEKYEHGLTLLYSIILIMSFTLILLCTLLAPILIGVLYGDDYSNAQGILRIVIWCTALTQLGYVRDIWLLAEDRQHLLWKINVAGAFANVLLNACLIPILGMPGAALASLFTQIVVNVIISFALPSLRPCYRLMLKGLNFKHLVSYLRNTDGQTSLAN